MIGPALIRHSNRPLQPRAPQTRFEAWVAADRARQHLDRLRARYEAVAEAGDPTVAQDLGRELLEADARWQQADAHFARFEPIVPRLRWVNGQLGQMGMVTFLGLIVLFVLLPALLNVALMLLVLLFI